MAATSTMYTFLMHSTSSTGTYSLLVPIKSFPDLGQSPDLLDKTTLSESAYSYIKGLQGNDIKEFTCNYDEDDYDSVKALAGTDSYYSVWFGGTESGGTVTPTGDYGKFDFTGDIDVYVSGKGVNEVREMVVSIVPSSKVTKS